MPDVPLRLWAFVSLLLMFAGCAGAPPTYLASPSPLPAADDTVFFRLYRNGFQALTCPYDEYQVACGDYLLARYAQSVARNDSIEELAISGFSFACERQGAMVARQNCTAKYRLDYRVNGETLFMNVSAQKEKAPLPNFGDKASAIYKYIGAILERTVQEFEDTL